MNNLQSNPCMYRMWSENKSSTFLCDYSKYNLQCLSIFGKLVEEVSSGSPDCSVSLIIEFVRDIFIYQLSTYLCFIHDTATLCYSSLNSHLYLVYLQGNKECLGTQYRLHLSHFSYSNHYFIYLLGAWHSNH